MIRVSRTFITNASHYETAAYMAMEMANDFFDKDWTSDQENWIPHLELVRDNRPNLTMDTKPPYWRATLTATGHVCEIPE